MVIDIKEDRLFAWLKRGAQPTDTLRSLLQRKGLWLQWGLMKKGADEPTIAAAVEKWQSLQEEKQRRETEKKSRRKAAKKAKAAAAIRSRSPCASRTSCRARGNASGVIQDGTSVDLLTKFDLKLLTRTWNCSAPVGKRNLAEAGWNEAVGLQRFNGFIVCTEGV